MANVKIDIPGIGEVVAENAASERTLLEILKVMQQGSSAFDDKSKTTGSSSAPKELDKVAVSSKKTYTGLGVLANIAGKVLGGAFNLLAASVSSAVGSFIGLGKELLNGGDRLTDFAKHIPIPGLQMLTKLIDDQVDQYRELSNAGAGFSNSIIEISRVAAQAGMPQKEFLGMVAENSQQLKRFGGSVQGGGRLFADMSKQMRRSQMGMELMNLGFTAGELNENMIGFSEITNMAGTRQNLTTQQLITGSLKYSDTLDTLSRTTGKHRDLIAAQIKDMMNDATMQRAVAMYGEEFAASLAALPDGTDSLAKAVLDMVDGIPHDDVSKGFLQVSDTFKNGAAAFGDMSSAEKQAFLAKVSQETTAYVDSLSVEQLESLKRSGGIMAEIVQESANLRKVSAADMEALKKEKAEQEAIAKKMTNFEQTIANVRTKIKLALIDSGIFDKIVTTIEKFIPSTEEANAMFETASKYFTDKILPKLQSVYDWFTKEGETGTTKIQEFLSWFKDKAMPMAMEAFKFLEKLTTADGRKEIKDRIIKEVKELTHNLMGGLIDWFTDPVNLIGALTAALLLFSPAGMMLRAVKILTTAIVGLFAWDKIKEAWANWTPIDDLVEGIKSFSKSVTDWFSGLFDGINFTGMVSSVIPNWLKKWLPDSWTGSGQGPTDTEVAEAQNTKTDDAKNPEADKKEKETETADADLQKAKTEETAKATSESQTELAMLNSNMQQLIELTKKNTTAVKALNGNIMAG